MGGSLNRATNGAHVEINITSLDHLSNILYMSLLLKPHCYFMDNPEYWVNKKEEEN